MNLTIPGIVPTAQNVLTIFFLGLVAAGCTVTREVYVQDLTVNGPIATPAIRPGTVAQAGEITVSPWVSTNTQKSLEGRISGHTNVGSDGLFEVDTLWESGNAEFQPRSSNVNPFSGNNLHWSLPGTRMGLDLGVHVSPAVQLTGGVGLSTAGSEKWWSWNLGLGVTAVRKTMAIRFDAGIQMQNLSYSAASVDVVTTEWFFTHLDSRAYFYDDSGIERSVGYYATLAINTLFGQSPVNGIVQIGITRQILADFRPGTSATFIPMLPHDVEEQINNKTTFVSLTPGVMVSVPDGHRLIAAVRFAWETESERLDPAMVLMPVIQCDIVF